MVESERVTDFVHQRIAERPVIIGRVGIEACLGCIDNDVAVVGEVGVGKCAAWAVDVLAADADISADAERAGGAGERTTVVGLIDEVDTADLAPAVERLFEKAEPRAGLKL